ncbi:MAG: YggS family pyridoxal phosphate-dependent enzyme [Hyphomicrobiales bacterium]|nr:YggS family pyridoxal phosphate-dependent enzyme [Hyphomicrobiales bacterium]
MGGEQQSGEERHWGGDGHSGVAEALAGIRAAIARAEADHGRPAGSVTLVAVSKTKDADAIRPALAAGQRVFGENRVQEAQAKWPGLRAEQSGIELHLIGPLQTNKLREAVALFDVIETLDREKLARALAEERIRSGRCPRLLVQVNTGGEPQKAGVAPEEADAFLRLCRETLDLPVEGLLCIPPVDEPPSPHFALLAEIARRHRLPVLSMGMSADFDAAIQLGATHVRIGSAIFGARPPLSGSRSASAG